jgi:hypothetical protein
MELTLNQRAVAAQRPSAQQAVGELLRLKTLFDIADVVLRKPLCQ